MFFVAIYGVIKQNPKHNNLHKLWYVAFKIAMS